MFETSRLPSATTSYNLNWPGRATLSKIAVAPGSLIMDSIKKDGDYTQFTLKERNAEPPRPGLETQQPVDHDRFSFVWVNGKEAMSFTDQRLRLKLRTEIPLFDQARNSTLLSRYGSLCRFLGHVGLDHR
jgi:hypothetical protein